MKVKYIEFVNEKIGTINHRINFILENIQKRFEVISVQQAQAISESGVVKRMLLRKRKLNVSRKIQQM